MPNPNDNDPPEGAIAIIGIGCRLPGASDAEQFWYNLRDSAESVFPLSDDELRKQGVSESDLSEPNYVKRAAYLEEMEMFDAGFFGFSPKEAAIMDPQHRQFLECCWEAFENASYDPAKFDGAIGVYAGCGMNTYFTNHLAFNQGLMKDPGYFLVRHTGNDKDFLPTRVAYQFDLKGPSVSVQTACSSSLVAVHLASQSLLSGESDMALAGGVTIELPHRQGYHYRDGEILSHDGHCRSFEADSTGTVFGSGSGVVVLRRLEDAVESGDHIYATILGSAINNDGSNKVSFLAPSIDGQANAVSEALAVSGVDADTITYVETHGTGTQIGDPIEVAALTQAFRETTSANSYCALSALKSNIGHLDTAAGVAGLIKVALSLENRKIPATLHFKKPNPKIDFASTPFFVNASLRDWSLPEGINYRRATVNSLGVGGTNAHVVLEEAPALDPSDSALGEQLIVVSARTKNALDSATEKLADFLERNPDTNLADAAFTLQTSRRAFRNRRVVAVKDASDAIECLRSKDKDRMHTAKATERPAELVFMFPGGGAQYAGMGADLYHSQPVYQSAWDECIDHLETELADKIRSLVFASNAERPEATKELERPSLALPGLLATEYALVKLLQSWGATPKAFIGHSMGEYAAACLSGVISIGDAVRMVRVRGELFEKVPQGGMLSVSLSESEARSRMPDTLDIAAANAPELCVASGPVEEIANFQAKLDAEEIDCTRIHIDVAAHSSMLELILEEFRAFCKTITFHPPTIPFASNLTGKWIEDTEATDPEYWVQHLRNTVKFADNVATVLKDNSDSVLVEIGPGRTLSSLARAGETPAAATFNSMRHPKESRSDLEVALNTFGRIWASGVDVKWVDHWKGQKRRRIPLPTYSFDHSPYWIDSAKPSEDVIDLEKPLKKRPDVNDWFGLYAWSQSGYTSPKKSIPAKWLVFADNVGISDISIGRISGIENLITVRQGDGFGQVSDTEFLVRPNSEEDFQSLFSVLEKMDLLPDQVAYFWSVEDRSVELSYLQSFDIDLQTAFWGLFNLSKVLSELSRPMDVAVVSSDMHTISGESSFPGKATLLGPIYVLPHEVSGVTARSIDFNLHGRNESQQHADAARIAKELRSETSHPVVAFRGSHRWIRNLEDTHISERAEGDNWIRKGGAYLITGGLGGIGLLMARALAESGAGHIVLLGRSGLPPRDQWQNYQATHSPVDRFAKRIRKVQEIESLGARVSIVSANVADADSVASAIVEAKKTAGSIQGVIHAAGVINDQIIALKTSESAQRVLDAKAKGAAAVDKATREEPLDFFVVFSSVASFLGLQGQIDYAAANAYLDAFARDRDARGAPGRSLAINWNAWRDVGMAVEAQQAQTTGTSATIERRSCDHPALGDAVRLGDRAVVFSREYDAESDWLLSEHVVKGAEALIPGTGFVEMIRAATVYGSTPDNKGIELRDIQFIAPFQVAKADNRTLNIKRERTDEGYRIILYSESEDNPHATGFGRLATLEQFDSTDLSEIRNRCPNSGALRGKHMDQEFLEFGPRWGCINAIHYGRREALIEIELPQEFTGDLEHYQLHPAILDMATGSAQRIVEGFDPEKDFYVPLAYESVAVHGPLPRELVSHVVWHPCSEKDLAKYQVSLLDLNGKVLVRIDGFTMKRLDKDSSLSKAGSSARQKREDTLLESILREAIAPDEGVAAFDRIMACTDGPQWIISSVDAKQWRKQLDAESLRSSRPGTEGDSAEGADRPIVDSDFVAPRNETEQKIATIWQDILGIKGIGVEDDFFELGGHSLLLTRAAARIRKDLSVNLPLSAMFDAPTIAKVGEQVEKLKSRSDGTPALPDLKRVSRKAIRIKRPVTN